VEGLICLTGTRSGQQDERVDSLGVVRQG